DLQGRIVNKRYPDGTAQSIVYEVATSRVHSVTDALNQITAYVYNSDDTPASIAYSALLREEARARVKTLWKQHPHYSVPQLIATQIIRQLGPRPVLTVPWVQKILRECGRACGWHTRRQRLRDRRRFNTAQTRPSPHRS